MERLKENNTWSWGGILTVVGSLVVGRATMNGLLGAVTVATVVGVGMLEDERKKKQQVRDHCSKEEYVGVEYDTAERGAKVYLYTNPPAAMPGSITVDEHHWKIVVHFEDGAYRTIEGYEDDEDDCKMYGHYDKQPPRNYTHEEFLGHVHTSPHKLWKCAKYNKLNGTPYNATDNNCQDWALAAAEEISEGVFRQLSGVQRLHPLLAGPLAVVSALTRALPSSGKK